MDMSVYFLATFRPTAETNINEFYLRDRSQVALTEVLRLLAS